MGWKSTFCRTQWGLFQTYCMWGGLLEGTDGKVRTNEHKLQKSMDEAYQESVQQALKQAEEDGGRFDFGPAPLSTPPSPWDCLQPQQLMWWHRKKKKRCFIM